MRDHDIPERADRGLSTEDIAHPSPPRSGTDESPPAGGADDRQAASEPPPIYPGESTETPGLGAEPDQGAPEDRSDAEGESTSATESTQGYESAAPDATSQDGGGAEPEGGSTRADAVSRAADEDDSPRLLSSEDEEAFRSRWHDIQSLFVDDPREAVHAADGLVADVMQTLAATFSDHKTRLEGQWSEGERVDTESLRVALRQYRSFFNRLLTN
ncbi:hypothetical protein [Streptomyces sp. NPDC048350]|uniref:hypothetical protein n=1 Tax=Streptomyces sp. NPDC048350 TaxID=3365538 RepID=UPI00370FB542